MNKIFLTLSLLLAGGLSATAQQINGDMNHDGKVDVTDVSILIGTVLGDKDCEYIFSQINGDINHDGQVDVTDLSILIGTVLGERDYEYISGDKTYTVNGVSFKMIAVEGGTFTMGATSEQTSSGYTTDGNERPTHSVTLSSYSIGETEVTQALWHAVMDASPGSKYTWSSAEGLGDNYPAYYISWNECQEFITKLNTLTGETFRMPTEAEWEYAARGGNKSKGYVFSGSSTIDSVAWWRSNSSSIAHPVASKPANELGIYDMSGNLQEWCSDWYGGYSSDAQTDPTGPSSGVGRVARGGYWKSWGTDCRVTYRSYVYQTGQHNFQGLRLAH